MVRVSPASPSKWIGDAVAVAGLDVSVDAVVGDVELTADEPLRERRVVPVERALEVLRPRDAGAGLLGPEPLVVLRRGVVHRGRAVGLRGERRVGGEVHLVRVAGQAVVGHGVLLLVECQAPSQPRGEGVGNTSSTVGRQTDEPSAQRALGSSTDRRCPADGGSSRRRLRRLRSRGCKLRPPAATSWRGAAPGSRRPGRRRRSRSRRSRASASSAR